MMLALFLLILSMVYLAQPMPIHRFRTVKQARPKQHQVHAGFRDEADAVALIAMTLSTGTSIEKSLQLCSQFGPEFLRDDLMQVAQSLQNGQTFEKVLHGVCQLHPNLKTPMQLLVTSAENGNQCVEALNIIALHMHEQVHHLYVKRLRSLAVRCVLPLAICFLPAFIALAIVPLVVSMFGRI